MKKTLPLPLYAFILLALVGGIFYASYGFSNSLADSRSDVREIFFHWEQSIPFMAWTVVPYWSLNLFYALAFFLCKNKQELHHYVKQLLAAQVIAIVCFILFPLQFSWEKPATDGFLGTFFSSLAAFDKPYNQAPSLHIILSLIIGRFYWHKIAQYSKGIFTNILRATWVMWVVLIGASVLTTYQHHFIDIPTGLIVGLVILWAFQHPNNSLFAKNFFSHNKKTQQHKRWIFLYLGLSVFFILITWGLTRQSPVWLWLLYPALSCGVVALAYICNNPAIFQKNQKGKLSFAATLLLLPYLIMARLNIWFWLRGKSKNHTIKESSHGTISVGSVCSAKNFTHVIDVCGEYPCFAQEKIPFYHSIPMLDMVSPTPTLLREAAEIVEQQRTLKSEILICCALGYGRSVAVAITWLLRYGDCKTMNEALELMKTAHPHMVLSKHTKSAIEEAIKNN